MIVDIRHAVIVEGSEDKKVNLQVMDCVCSGIDDIEMGAMTVAKALAAKHPPTVFWNKLGKPVIRFWHEI